MSNDIINLVVETKDGRPLRTFNHEGKTFIESREGTEYSLRVKNKTNRRVMAVVTVDGINVVSGKTASDKPNETGYVFGPHEEHLIKGYRVNENDVASFKFVKREQSYATERGNGAGNGVIAVRVWGEKNEEVERLKRACEDIRKKYEEEKARKPEREYVPYPVYPVQPWYPWDTSPWYQPYRPIPIWYSDVICKSSDTIGTTSTSSCGQATNANHGDWVYTNCSNGSITASACNGTISNMAIESSTPFQHGSSWGSEIKDSVREVAFEPSELLTEVSIFYAPREGLKELGIDIDKTKAVAFPEPFKREYCSPPKSWTGFKG